jgi:hypothetical protein
MTPTGPKGWHVGLVEHRFVDTVATSPLSYDAKGRSVNAVISMGSPVARFYGREILRIDQSSIILDRVASGSAPLLDSHKQDGISNVLGKIASTWIRGGALWGKLVFAETRPGRAAEGMVARGEIAGISAGYRVEEWEIADEDGNIIDPEVDRVRWDDDLTFTATRWELLEASLVAVPAESSASIRSLEADPGRPLFIPDARARMWARQRMVERMSGND